MMFLINVLEGLGISVQRHSTDNKCNNYGNRLIQLCNNSCLIIINGRLSKDRVHGYTTCDSKSVIDYIMCSPGMIESIAEFEVMPFCYLLSDKHNVLSMSLERCTNNVKIVLQQSHKVTKIKWAENSKSEFMSEVRKLDKSSIVDKITLTQNNCSKKNNHYIDTIVQHIYDMFTQKNPILSS